MDTTPLFSPSRTSSYESNYSTSPSIPLVPSVRNAVIGTTKEFQYRFPGFKGGNAIYEWIDLEKYYKVRIPFIYNSGSGIMIYKLFQRSTEGWESLPSSKEGWESLPSSKGGWRADFDPYTSSAFPAIDWIRLWFVEFEPALMSLKQNIEDPELLNLRCSLKN